MKINVFITAKGDGWKQLYTKLKTKMKEVEDAEVELVRKLILLDTPEGTV